MDFDYVRFTFPDLNGVPRGKTIPRNFVEDTMQNGVGSVIDVIARGAQNNFLNLKEIEDKKYGNVLFLPDTEFIHPLPWAGCDIYKVGEVICESYWTENGVKSPVHSSGRSAAKKQLQRLAEEGYGLKSAFEIEFCLEDLTTGKPIFDGVRVYEDHLVSKFGKLLFGAEKNFQQIGIATTAIHIEAEPGQFEFVIESQSGITGADQAFIVKHGLKEMAGQHGMIANFMGRPWLDRNNADHFNHSLWSEDFKTNLFYDVQGHCNLSELAQCWLGGLCKHGRAITALCSPTTNGYRQPTYWLVPRRSDWGLDNRHTAFRVKSNSPTGCLVENRIPAACNPYLVLAATVAAGLDGIINKLPLPAQWNPKADPLPLTLQEGLVALQQDQVIVDALGPDLIKWFIESKTQVDLKIMAEFDPVSIDEMAFLRERELYSLWV